MKRIIYRRLMPVFLTLAMVLGLLPAVTLPVNAESSTVSNQCDKTEIFFVDTKIPDYIDLTDHFRQRGEIVYFNGGIEQIADTLAERTGIDCGTYFVTWIRGQDLSRQRRAFNRYCQSI